MTSHLRLQSTFDPIEMPTTQASYPSTFNNSRPTKKPKMTLTQTYYVASTARSKLGREAARADHNLRRLVGHANMLDQLMVELSQAEAEQEAWFNNAVRTANTKQPERAGHVQWVDTIAEEAEYEDDQIYDEDEESDDGEDSDYEDFHSEMFNVPLRRIKSPPVAFMGAVEEVEDDTTVGFEMEMEIEEEEERSTSPPELTYDEASDSEEEMPSSPRNASLEWSEKERQEIASYHSALVQSEDLVAQREQQRQPLIAAC